MQGKKYVQILTYNKCESNSVCLFRFHAFTTEPFLMIPGI